MKAISLFSGGLDSQLAAYLIKEQGITVVGVNFQSPFFGADEGTFKAAEQLGIQLETLNIDRDYIDNVLKNPVYGYGKNMNPCIDCHAYMIRKAGDFMKEIGASFLITGEVVGQRPMSQNKSSMNAVDKLSGYKGLIVRPLSAKLLPETQPEQQGWIDRNRLLDISGRGRTRQMEMAKLYEIHDYPTPAGGCLLTEENFARRLKKLLESRPECAISDMSICKLGRHFYIGNGHLLVIGRNHSENQNLEQINNNKHYLFKVIDRPGPLGLLQANDIVTPAELEYAASIVARYSDAKNEPLAQVKVYHSDGVTDDILEIAPMSPDQVPATV